MSIVNSIISEKYISIKEEIFCAHIPKEISKEKLKIITSYLEWQ